MQNSTLTIYGEGEYFTAYGFENGARDPIEGVSMYLLNIDGWDEPQPYERQYVTTPTGENLIASEPTLLPSIYTFTFSVRHRNDLAAHQFLQRIKKMNKGFWYFTLETMTDDGVKIIEDSGQTILIGDVMVERKAGEYRIAAMFTQRYADGLTTSYVYPPPLPYLVRSENFPDAWTSLMITDPRNYWSRYYDQYQDPNFEYSSNYNPNYIHPRIGDFTEFSEEREGPWGPEIIRYSKNDEDPRWVDGIHYDEYYDPNNIYGNHFDPNFTI